MLGVSLRKFHAMRTELPAPVVLGPRAVRWKAADLRRYVEDLVGVDHRPEPRQLSAALAKEAKPGLIGAPAVESEATRSAIERRRGFGQKPVQSNPEGGTDAESVAGIQE
jgi:hypothetical protein